MTRTQTRVANAGIGLIVALAAIDVTVAKAQLQSNILISTTCGAGTIEKCGEEPFQQCDWKLVFAYNPLTNSFEFRLDRTNCTSYGVRPIYKNKFAPCPTTTTTNGGGSTGTGLSGMRGSGEEDEMPSDGDVFVETSCS